MTLTQKQIRSIYSEIDFLYEKNKKHPSYYTNKKIGCLYALAQNKLTLEGFLALISPWEQKEYVTKLQIQWFEKPKVVSILK